MSDISLVGRNVRRLRTARHLSLNAVAQRAGLAKQTLANLESGAGNPTIETLLAVADALGVGATWLLTEWGSPVIVRRAGAARWVDGRYGARRALDEIFGTGQVQSSLVELAATQVAASHHAPGTLLHVYVLSGDVLAGTVEDQHQLTGGDFIRLPGDVPHTLCAASGSATVFMVTTVPQAQQFASHSVEPSDGVARGAGRKRPARPPAAG